MKRLLFLLFSLSGLGFSQTVNSVTYDNVSHSSIHIKFTVTGITPGWGYIQYVDITANPGAVCTGTTGLAQYTEYNGTMYATFGYYEIDVSGMTAGHTYSFCPRVSTNGTSYTTGGASVSVTLPSLPAIHPVPPTLPLSFSTAYPSDRSGALTLTLGGTNCANLNACLTYAINDQLNHAYIISVPANMNPATYGGVGPFGNGDGVIPLSPDVVNFTTANVNDSGSDVGSVCSGDSVTTKNAICITGHGFSENQLLQFGASYGCLPGNATSTGVGFPNCKSGVGNGLYPVFPRGATVALHKLDNNSFQLYSCPTSTPHCTVVQGTLITFADQGSGTMRYAPWPRRYDQGGKLHYIEVRTATSDAAFVPLGSRVQGIVGTGIPAVANNLNVPGKPTAWIPLMGNLAVPFNSSPPLITLGDNNYDPMNANIRFVGIHMYYTDTTAPNYSAHPFGGLAFIAEDLNLSDILFDRCYFDAPGTPFRTGNMLLFNGVNTGFVDCYGWGFEAWHQAPTGLGISQTSNSITIASGSVIYGTGSYIQPGNVTVTYSGTPSSNSTLWINASLSGVLEIVNPPGVTATVAGTTNYHIVNVNANGPSGFGANNQTYFASPVISASPSCTGLMDFTSTMNVTTPPPIASGYPGNYGVRFTNDANEYVCGVKFYKNSGDTGTSRTVTMQTTGGTVVASASTSSEPASGWITQLFATPAVVIAGSTYDVTYSTTIGPSQTFQFYTNTDAVIPGAHISGGYYSTSGAAFGSISGQNWFNDWYPYTTYGDSQVEGIAVAIINTSGVVTSAITPIGIGVLNFTGGGNAIINGLGPGPYMERGNFIMGSGLPWHHDNSGGRWAYRGDYNMSRNYHYMPVDRMIGTSYSDGMDPTNRQPLEWKGGNRILVDGDIFDGQEHAGGSWAMIAFQSPSEVNCITDITAQFNTFKHGSGTIGGGIEYNPSSTQPEPCTPLRTKIQNNISWDISGVYNPGGNGVGWWMYGQVGGEDVIIDHNTDIGRSGGKPVIWDLPEMPIEGVQITNNLFSVEPTYGGFETSNNTNPTDPCSAGGIIGYLAANCKFTPSYTFSNNTLWPFNGSTQSGLQTLWPPANYFSYIPTNGAWNSQGFFNALSAYSAVNIDPDLHLNSSSSWCAGCGSASSDKLNMGANIDLLLMHQGYANITSAIPTGTTTATVTVLQSENGTCYLDYSSTDPNIVTSFTRVGTTCSASTGPQPVTFSLTGLTTKTQYWIRFDGEVYQPYSIVRTK